jgi:hypothetical protein
VRQELGFLRLHVSERAIFKGDYIIFGILLQSGGWWVIALGLGSLPSIFLL